MTIIRFIIIIVSIIMTIINFNEISFNIDFIVIGKVKNFESFVYLFFFFELFMN